MPDPLENKNIIILGMARQGTALAKWACEIGANVTISDLRPAERLSEALSELAGLPVQTVLGEHPFALLEGADLLCLSGGVPIDAPIVIAARERGIRLANDAQLFIERCPCHVVGITGSAGKTTTTSLVGKMLEEAGMLPWVGGNIGNPLINDLPYIRPDDIAVLELSSFQLDLMTTSPHIAAILNITPNHLDRHKTMEAYIAAKANILAHQVVGDMAVLAYDDPNAAALADRVSVELVQFSARVPVDVGAWLVNDRLVCRPQYLMSMEPVCNVDEINLRGAHNVLNVLAACAIAGAAGAPVEAMREAIRKFQPVPHRLEVVRELDGVTFINDSIATAPERVMAALAAYADHQVVLLLGGRDKDLPWEDLLRTASRHARAIITFGAAGKMIAEKSAEQRRVRGLAFPIEQVMGLPDAVEMAYELAHDGDVVLLSPGCTSYDAYEDFEERGQHFRELVNKLE